MGFDIGGALGGLVKGFFGGSKIGEALGTAVKGLFDGGDAGDIFKTLAKAFLDTSDIKATGSAAGSTGDTVAAMASAIKGGDGAKIGETVGTLLSKK